MASSDFLGCCVLGRTQASSLAQLLGLLASGGATPMFRHISSTPFATFGCQYPSRCVCVRLLIARLCGCEKKRRVRQTCEDSFHVGAGSTGLGTPPVRWRGSLQKTRWAAVAAGAAASSCARARSRSSIRVSNCRAKAKAVERTNACAAHVLREFASHCTQHSAHNKHRTASKQRNKQSLERCRRSRWCRQRPGTCTRSG